MMNTMITVKHNNANITYKNNMFSSVRPYATETLDTLCADSLDFHGIIEPKCKRLRT